MSKFKHFVGIDMSKEFFDAVVLVSDELSFHCQFLNSPKGCKEFLKWLKRFDIVLNDTLICVEHTGMYVNILSSFCVKQELNLWVEMSYKIIRSSGIQRGKTDKIDAGRIANYARKNQENAVLFKPKKQSLTIIQSLSNTRTKLMKSKVALEKEINELKTFDKEIAKELTKHTRLTIKGIVKDIKTIEKRIDEIIKEDERLKELMKITTSVSGVGKVIAIAMICATNEFENFTSPRQLACYCGVVPFEYTSGKSIKGRSRVHFMANKHLKQLLHMGAMSASRNDPELNNYFNKKVAEGKSKMLVINNIRNKIVHRVCACVRENRVYQPQLNLK